MLKRSPSNVFQSPLYSILASNPPRPSLINCIFLYHHQAYRVWKFACTSIYEHACVVICIVRHCQPIVCVCVSVCERYLSLALTLAISSSPNPISYSQFVLNHMHAHTRRTTRHPRQHACDIWRVGPCINYQIEPGTTHSSIHINTSEIRLTAMPTRCHRRRRRRRCRRRCQSAAAR